MNPRTTSSADGGRITAISTTPTLADQASAQLRESPYNALREIDCRAQAGVVTLTGTVPSYHLKQVAQTLVGNLQGVQRVDNRLEVAEHDDAAVRHPMTDAH